VSWGLGWWGPRVRWYTSCALWCFSVFFASLNVSWGCVFVLTFFFRPWSLCFFLLFCLYLGTANKPILERGLRGVKSILEKNATKTWDVQLYLGPKASSQFVGRQIKKKGDEQVSME